MEKTGGLRELKQTQVKRAIFDAAVALAQEKGFDATTVDEIAARALVSRATFFNHFQTKDGVLRYYGEQLAERSARLLAEIGGDRTPLEQIHAFLSAWVDLTESSLPNARLILQYSARNPDYLVELTPARKELWNLLSGLVEEGQKLGEIRRDIPPQHIALHILSAYQSAIIAHVFGSGYASGLLESAWDFVLGGIKDADSTAE